MSPRLTPTTKKDKTDPKIILPIIEVIQPPPSPTLSTIVVSSPPFAVEIPVRSKPPPAMVESSLPYEVLDLAIDGISSSELCRNTMKLFANAKRIIVVAGAGISVAAGIPDFRSSTGLFSTLKADTKFKPSGKALFDASVYKSEVGTQSYNEMISELHKLTTKAEPTSFHSFLDKISSRLVRLYTQNIDSLENRFESLATQVPLPPKAPWPKTIQLHGDLKYAVCSKCHWVGKLDPSQLAPGGEMGCMECREADDVRQVVGKRPQGIGIIRPRVVLYHEPNPDADAIGTVSNADISSRPPPDLVIVVGTSLKIPGTKRITRESVNAVHHTPRGKAIWINLDPPPTKDFDIWIKGDCQLLPTLHEDYQLFNENEKSAKLEEIKRKEEEKVRVVEERMEKKAREQARKGELALEREKRKERKEREKEEKIRREEERKRRKEEKEAEKKRRELERAIRPSKKKVKVNGEKWARPLTPPLSYDTDSTLSSPSLSDVEFASLHESTPRTTPQKTPKKNRVIEYLPTPASTPQKGSQIQEQDSPLKKRSLIWMDESNKKPRTSEGNGNGQRRDSMSIRFLTEDSD